MSLILVRVASEKLLGLLALVGVLGVAPFRFARDVAVEAPD